ncbi:hypothetical protein TNCV_4022391 [Trichonephila clavipes]|nr:hypothetical protein TNCV_4022391 [Trichonephila clavipes]
MSARRNKRITTPQHARDIASVSQERSSCHGHHKNGGVFVSVMSRHSPEKFIFAESSTGEKVELAYIPPT